MVSLSVLCCDTYISVTTDNLCKCRRVPQLAVGDYPVPVVSHYMWVITAGLSLMVSNLNNIKVHCFTDWFLSPG